MMDKMEWLSELEHDLKIKKDRHDSIGDLSELVSSDDPEIRCMAVWCMAKMGQNKVSDKTISDVLIPLCTDGDPQIREDAVWGLGELCGAGICDDRAVEMIKALLSDDERAVRGMAAWAAGRAMHKTGRNDEEMTEKLKKLSKDPSEYVRKAAEFALNG